MSQQKDSDPEESKRLHHEKEAHLKRIQQLSEESTRLKAEVSRWGVYKLLNLNLLNLPGYWVFIISPLFNPTGSFFAPSALINLQTLIFLFSRTNNLTTSLQSQIQNLRDNMSKMTDDRNALKKEVEAKNQELQDKVRTITQVKKIGRRYKTQYDELKVEHDTVRAQELSTSLPSSLN